VWTERASGTSSVEQFAPERSALSVLSVLSVLDLLPVVMVLASEIRVLEALATVVASRPFLDMQGSRRIATHRLNRAFDQLVQFASVKPDATTSRAIVDLDALAVGHDKLYGLAHRTEHGHAFLQIPGEVKGIVLRRDYRFLKAAHCAPAH
jgi:hypothetical protein